VLDFLSIPSTFFCVTSIFFQIWWNIYLFAVEEPLAVTNIKVVKLKPWLAGACRVIEQHSLRHNKNRNTNQLSDLKPNKIFFH
jgi:hypothetical protein